MTTVLLAPLGLFGSISDPGQVMRSANLRLAGSELLTVTATSEEIRGSQTRRQKVTFGMVHRPGLGDVRLELIVEEGGRLTHRIAADGKRVWAWEAVGNTYLSRSYSTEEGLAPNWRERVFGVLGSQTSGAASFVVRLVADAYGPGALAGKAWLPWIPTSKLDLTDKAVVARAVTPSPSETKYWLERDPDMGYDLVGATFQTSLTSGRSQGSTGWYATIEAGTLPENVEFGFNAPRGSRVRATETGG